MVIMLFITSPPVCYFRVLAVLLPLFVSASVFVFLYSSLWFVHPLALIHLVFHLVFAPQVQVLVLLRVVFLVLALLLPHLAFLNHLIIHHYSLFLFQVFPLFRFLLVNWFLSH